MQTNKKLIGLVLAAGGRPFTKNDWYGYCDCESKDPHIAEVGDRVVVADGGRLSIMWDEGDAACDIVLQEVNTKAAANAELLAAAKAALATYSPAYVHRGTGRHDPERLPDPAWVTALQNAIAKAEGESE